MSSAAVAFFVGIGLSVIRVERKVAVRSGIHAHLGDLLHLIRAFDWHSQRHNRTGTHKQRQRIDWSGNINSLSTVDTLVGPIVVPIGARRQIDHAAGRSLFGDWRYKKRRTKHVLVA